LELLHRRTTLSWSTLDPSAGTIASHISIWHAGVVVEEATPSEAEESMSPPPSLALAASQSFPGEEGEGESSTKGKKEATAGSCRCSPRGNILFFIHYQNQIFCFLLY
jgi:hypothetical protein